MASPKCPPSAPQRLENTTRKFSGSSDLARPKSMVCMKAVPFRKHRNMRSSATTLSGRRDRTEPPLAVKFTKVTRASTMDDIVTEHAGSILRVQLNRPTKRNAMTSAMYLALAGIFNEAANDENTRVILWHGAGDSFCAGNDIEDFLKKILDIVACAERISRAVPKDDTRVLVVRRLVEDACESQVHG